MYYEELKKLINDKNITKEEFSRLLGITYDVLDKKLNGDLEFTLWEIKYISQIFSLKKRQIMNIFF